MATRRIVKRNRKPAERAIIFAAVIGGLTLEDTRQLLEEAGYGDRGLPKASWDILHKAYLPKFLERPDFVGTSIFSPRAMGDLGDI